MPDERFEGMSNEPKCPKCGSTDLSEIRWGNDGLGNAAYVDCGNGHRTWMVEISEVHAQFFSAQPSAAPQGTCEGCNKGLLDPFEHSGCLVDKAMDKELARWQQKIYELLRKHAIYPDGIDGGGCDSGDPLDFTLAEIGQLICQLENPQDYRPTGTHAEKEGDANAEHGRVGDAGLADWGEGSHPLSPRCIYCGVDLMTVAQAECEKSPTKAHSVEPADPPAHVQPEPSGMTKVREGLYESECRPVAFDAARRKQILERVVDTHAQGQNTELISDLLREYRKYLEGDGKDTSAYRAISTKILNLMETGAAQGQRSARELEPSCPRCGKSDKLHYELNVFKNHTRVVKVWCESCPETTPDIYCRSLSDFAQFFARSSAPLPSAEHALEAADAVIAALSTTIPPTRGLSRSLIADALVKFVASLTAKERP